MKLSENMKSPMIITLLLSLFVSLAPIIGAENNPEYKNPSLTVEQRVEDLLGRMTVQEKVAQLINLFPPGLALENKTIDDVLTGDGIGGVTRVDVFSGRTTNSARESAMIVNEVQKKLIENTRLGIPAIIHNEALHGLTAKGATSFPQAIGLAAKSVSSGAALHPIPLSTMISFRHDGPAN